MYCKLCGKHLYESITLEILFKWNYDLHMECEKRCIQTSEYHVFPLEDTMVYYDSLLDDFYEASDDDFLFTKYMGLKLHQAITNHNRSMIVLGDDIRETNDLLHVLHLAGEKVIMITLFSSVQFD